MWFQENITAALLSLRELNYLSIIVRLSLAILCGGIIGYDRSKKRRPAGFRTHILVCIGSALVMITSQYIVEVMEYSADPSRLGAQVISGIGFLGAGTIIVTGKQQVKGLTTAAGLWASACMGLAIGIGFYEGALIGCAFIFASMTILHRFDEFVTTRTRIVDLYLEVETVNGINELYEFAKHNHVEISSIEILKIKHENIIALYVSLRQKEKHNHAKIIGMIASIPEVIKVEEAS